MSCSKGFGFVTVQAKGWAGLFIMIKGRLYQSGIWAFENTAIIDQATEAAHSVGATTKTK